MDLSKKQVKFFRRILRKYKVSCEFLSANFNKIIQLYNYAISRHIVIKKKFLLRKRRAFIIYNHLRKNLFQTKRKKTRSWAKRFRLFRKKLRKIQKFQYKTVEYEIVEHENMDNTIVEDENIENVIAKEQDSHIPLPEEVQQKLKEHLDILNDKRTISLLKSYNIKRSKPYFTNALAERNLPKKLKANLFVRNNLKRKPDEDYAIINIIQENTAIDTGHHIEKENVTPGSNESDTPYCCMPEWPPTPPTTMNLPSDENTSSNSFDFTINKRLHYQQKMNLSKNQMKLFHRVHRKYKVSLEFLAANFNKVISLYNYAISHLIVIRQKLRLRKNRAFIIYNHLRKNQFKAKRKKKRSWTNHFKLHRKKLRVIHKLQYETVEDEIGQHRNTENPILDDKIGADENIEAEISEEQDVHILSPEEVQQKLYEQLDILKSGKRNISLLGSDSTERNQQSSTNYSAENSQRNAPNQLKGNFILGNILESKSYLPKDYSISNRIQKNTTMDKEEENFITKEIVTKKRSDTFLDSLIKKIQCKKNITVSSASSEFDVPCSSISPPSEKQHLNEETTSSSSSFHGFTDLDVDTGRVPGMLPTPIVNRTLEGAQNSAFVSEKLEKFLKENALDNCTNVEIPKRNNIEEGLMCDGTPMPKMYMPEMSDEYRRPRTVAEKRAILLHKQNNMKYCMLDDEHTIYRELQRHSKPFYKPNLDIANQVQNSDAPATRDCWKATTWLSTEKGRFFLQIANIDNIEYKIIGTRGNNYSKILPKQKSMVSLKKVQLSNCPLECHRLIENFNLLKIINPVKKRFNLKRKLRTVPDLKMPIGSVVPDFVPKPSPFFKKCMNNQSNNLDLGPLEIYEMPKIELEVFPNIDKPLDDFIKPYLKMIMPSDLSREYAEFAVSTLVTKNKQNKNGSTGNSRESYKFQIPFLNNEHRLLVRKIFKRQEQIENYFNYKNLEFCKNIDKSDSNKEACVDIISDMINSIALGLSENAFIKEDPDINYMDVEKKNARTIADDNQRKHIKQGAAKKEKHGQHKLLSELKRLNATVIDANSFGEKEIKECKELHCRLGCVCQTLMGRPIIRQHCGKLSCMFECGCKPNPLFEIKDVNKIADDDALRLHEKATAKLAKGEKDFCSTIVLKDNEMFLINESQTDRKRTKKAPQRYDEYAVQEEDINNNQSDAICYSQGGTLNKEYMEKRKPLYIFSDEKTIDKFKHCSVALNRLRGFETVQPWCMIHCLYKCFCKNKATCRIPFEMEKVDDIVADDSLIHSRKRTYSFPKDNDKSLIKKQHKFGGINDHKVQDRNTDMKHEKVISTKEKYYNSCLQYGSRLTPIPEYYKNNKHKEALEHKVLKSDNSCKSLVAQAEDPRKSKKIADKTIADSNEISIGSIHNNTPNNINDTDTTALNLDIQKMPINTTVCSLNIAQMVTSPMSTPLSIPSEINEDDQLENNTNLGDLITDNNLSDEQTISEEFYKKSISKLNLLVTKKMNNICSIRKMDSKHTPIPVPNTLRSQKWQYFLQAYSEQLISVWEIKLEMFSFLAVTKANIMPLVPNALSAVNIKALRTADTLPLVAKMLHSKILNDKLKTLSVLMAGEKEYWRIIGFLNSTKNYLDHGFITTPTPETHPFLSKKVNQLYKILLARELKTISDFRNKRESLLKSITNKDSPSPPSVVATTSTLMNNSQKPSTRFKAFKDTPKEQLPPSNIVIQKLSNKIESISISIPIVSNHRWLMLSLADDFSHIYIPSWNKFLCYDKIKNTIITAFATKKTIRLGEEKSDLSVYATSEYKNLIYIGPFAFDKQLDIILYQRSNMMMILREDFERTNNIHRTTSTFGCWLYMKNGQLIFCDKEENSNYYDKNANTGDDVDRLIVEEEEEAGKKNAGFSFENSTNIISAKSYPQELNITPISSLPEELLAFPAHQPNSALKPIELVPSVSKGRTLTNSEDHSIFPVSFARKIPNKDSLNPVIVRAKRILKRRMTEYIAPPPNKSPRSLSVSNLETSFLNLNLRSQSANKVSLKNSIYYDKSVNTIEDDCVIVVEEETGKKDSGVSFGSSINISAKQYIKELDITPTSSLPDELLASPCHQPVDPCGGSVLFANQRNGILNPIESDSVPLLQDCTSTNSKDHSIPQLAASGIFSVSSATKIQNKGSINLVTIRAKPILKRRRTEYFSAPPNKYPLPSILTSLEMNSLNLNFPPHSTKEASLENSDYDKNTNVYDDDCIIIEEEEAGKKDDNLSFEGFRNIFVDSYPIELDITPTSSLPDELLASPSHQPVDPFNGSILVENQRNIVIKPTGSDSVPSLQDWKLSNSKDHSRPQLAASGIFVVPTKIQNKSSINPVTVRAKPILKRRMTEYSAAPRNKYPLISSLEMNSLNLSYYDKNTNVCDDDDCIIIGEEEAGKKDGGESFEGFRNISANSYPNEIDVTPTLSLSDEILASSSHQQVDPLNEYVLGFGNHRNNINNNLIETDRTLNNSGDHLRPQLAAPEIFPIPSIKKSQNEDSHNPVSVCAKPRLKRRMTQYFESPFNESVLVVGNHRENVKNPNESVSSVPLLQLTNSEDHSRSQLASSGTFTFPSATKNQYKGSFNPVSVRAKPILKRRMTEYVSPLIITSTPPKCRSENGFLVSNIIYLGKIPTMKLDTEFLINIPHYNSPLKVTGIDLANEMLQAYLRAHIKEFMPKDLCLKWRFINSVDPVAKHYKLHNVKILNSEMIITENSIFQKPILLPDDVSSKDESTLLRQIEACNEADGMKETKNTLKTNISEKSPQVAVNKTKLNHLKAAVPLRDDKQTKNRSIPPFKLIQSEVVLIDDDDD